MGFLASQTAEKSLSCEDCLKDNINQARNCSGSPYFQIINPQAKLLIKQGDFIGNYCPNILKFDNFVQTILIESNFDFTYSDIQELPFSFVYSVLLIKNKQKEIKDDISASTI